MPHPLKACTTDADARDLGRPAFTLIELLVVISIVALLVAILLPVLGAARETARTSVCASNLRNIGLAVLAYTDEYEDRMPTILDYGFATDPRYTPVERIRFQYWAARMERDGYLVEDVVYCPLLDDEDKSIATRVNSYGLRGNVIGRPDLPRNYEFDLPVSVILQPSAHVILADSISVFGTAIDVNGRYWIRADDLTGGQDPTANERVHMRHGDAANQTFLDGHVELLDAQSTLDLDNGLSVYPDP
ncbi:MAG: prepilin-type N-terminal cleavage/methylation domain-containing protein [Planctomycetota bacterium]